MHAAMTFRESNAKFTMRNSEVSTTLAGVVLS